LALSGAPAPGEPEVDQGEVGDVGQQSPRTILRDHGARTETARRGGRALAPHRRSHAPHPRTRIRLGGGTLMSNWSNNRSDDDFRDELESHLDAEVERQIRQRGLDEENARFAARRGFGNVLGAMERFHESRRWAWSERFT